MTKDEFIAKQAFERAAFIYGQTIAARKHAAEGTAERRNAVAAEDIAESRMNTVAARMFQRTQS